MGASRVGGIKIQVQLKLDRDQCLPLYLVWRTFFWVSFVSLDPFCGSLKDTEPASWFWFTNPHFLHRAHPWWASYKETPLGEL